MKKIIYALIALPLLLIFYFFAGDAWNEYSLEQKTRESIVNSILDDYYRHLSLTEKKGRYKVGDGRGEPKTKEEQEEAIKLRKLSRGLNDDWKFLDEQLDFHRITDAEYIFKYEYVFERINGAEVIFFEETYYIDLASVIPVPLKRIETTVDKKRDNDKVVGKFLWDGDFEGYMRHYFNIEMRRI